MSRAHFLIFRTWPWVPIVFMSPQISLVPARTTLGVRWCEFLLIVFKRAQLRRRVLFPKSYRVFASRRIAIPRVLCNSPGHQYAGALLMERRASRAHSQSCRSGALVGREWLRLA